MIRIAIRCAKRSTVRAKHGAILVRGKRILGRGSNTYKTHPRWGAGVTNSIHAEEAAIKDALRTNDPKDLRGTTLYVARYNPYGDTLSMPCAKRQELILKVGIKKVVYTYTKTELKIWKPT